MENITYIKDNYKRSTIVRLQEIFGYSNEQEINQDKHLTDTLVFLKEQGLEVQDALFSCLTSVKEYHKTK